MKRIVVPTAEPADLERLVVVLVVCLQARERPADLARLFLQVPAHDRQPDLVTSPDLELLLRRTDRPTHGLLLTVSLANPGRIAAGRLGPPL
jgi:hypothetical protein